MKIVIFCGGYGTRMWPASRKSYPKQFYPLLKGKSFFETTLKRFRKRYKPTDIFISSEKKYERFIKEQAKEIPSENVLLEPERRDTLGGVGLLSAVMAKRFPNDVMFFSWSDHLIGQEEEFLNAVETAGKYCLETGRPVSIDERPTFPSVYNGWLELGKKVDRKKKHEIYKIVRHIEKPDLKTAKKLFKSKKYLIHTGYGAWRTDAMLGYFKDYRPDIYKHLVKIQKAWGTDSEVSVLKKEYHLLEKDSVEFGLFEKLPKGLRVTIPVSVRWEDAGTWQLFYKAVKVGNEKNVEGGGVATQFLDSSGNLLVGRRGKLISAIGVNNLVIIDTDDALLICPMDQTGRVKKLFKILEKEKPRYVE